MTIFTYFSFDRCVLISYLGAMQSSQQIKRSKIFYRVPFQQRILAGVVFLGMSALFGFFRLTAEGEIDLGFWLGLCGFKQRFGLPCPTCGMTTSAVAFAEGKILEAFYIQPAVGLLCCILAVVAFLALFVAIFGVYFDFFERLVAGVKIKHIILVLILLIAAGWVVTLAQALAAGKQG